MLESLGTRRSRGEPGSRLSQVVVATALAAVGLAWAGGIAGPGRSEAQQTRGRGGDSSSSTPAHARMEFRQVEVVYTRMAEMIGEWEGKGWETYQVVPVFPVNPGVGRPMSTAIVFRRAAR